MGGLGLSHLEPAVHQHHALDTARLELDVAETRVFDEEPATTPPAKPLAAEVAAAVEPNLFKPM